MASAIDTEITLHGGQPWGIRLQGGFEFAQQLRIAKVNFNGKAYKHGIRAGDIVVGLNGLTCERMTFKEAAEILHDNKNDSLMIQLIKNRNDNSIAIPVRCASKLLQVGDSKQNMDHQVSSIPFFPLRYCNSGVPRSCTSDVNVRILSNVNEHTFSSTPVAAVWSPHGHQMKNYHPVHFDASKTPDCLHDSKASRDEPTPMNHKKISLPEKHSQSYNTKTSIKSSTSLRLASSKFPRGVLRNPRNKSDPGFSNDIYSENMETAPDLSKLAVKPPSFTSTNDFQKHYGSESLDENPVYRIRKKSCENVVKSLPSSPQMKRVQFALIQPTLNLQKSALNDHKDEEQKVAEEHSSIKENLEKVENSVELNKTEETTKTIQAGNEDGSQLNDRDELSSKDWYKQVFKVLHKIEDQTELDVCLIDNVDNAIPPRPKKEQKVDVSSRVNLKTKKDVNESSKPVIKEQRSKSLPDKETSTSKSDFPNSEIHRTFRMIQLNIKDDEKLEKIKTENTTEKHCDGDSKQNSFIDRVFANDKYWLSLAGLSKSGESLRKKMLLKNSSVSKRNEKSVAYALYNFEANSERELSFEQDDKIYVIRTIDQNWYEGELNGKVGLVPKNYIRLSNENRENLSPEQKDSSEFAIVKHNFNARTSAELPLKKGDIVTIMRQIDSNWFEGQIGGKIGLFPVAYVEQFSKINFSTGPEVESPRSLSSAGSSSLSIDPTLTSLPQSPFNTLPDYTSEHEKCLDSSKWSDDILQSIPAQQFQHNETNLINKLVNDNSDCLPDMSTNYRQYHEPWYKALYSYSPQHLDELDLREGDLIYIMAKCDDGWWVGRSDRTKQIGTFPGNYVKQIGFQ